MKHVVYTRPDGGVAVQTPSPGVLTEFMRFGRATGTLSVGGAPVPRPGDVLAPDAAEQAAIDLIIATTVPSGATTVVVVDTADLITGGLLAADRVRHGRFRDCCRQAGPAGPHVDMPLARMQRMAEVRAERDRRFGPFDREWTKAMGRGDAAAASALDAKREQLRAIPQAAEPILAAMTTPEALAAWEPTWPTAP